MEHFQISSLILIGSYVTQIALGAFSFCTPYVYRVFPSCGGGGVCGAGEALVIFNFIWGIPPPPTSTLHFHPPLGETLI